MYLSIDIVTCSKTNSWRRMVLWNMFSKWAKCSMLFCSWIHCRHVFSVVKQAVQWSEQQIFNGRISIVHCGFQKVCFLDSYDIVFYHDPDNRDYIDYYRIPESRWNKECCFCNSSDGCCMSCSGHKCTKTFHVSCGIKQNVLLEYRVSTSPDQPDLICGYCDSHTKLFKGKTNWRGKIVKK